VIVSYRLSNAAQHDIVDILTWTQGNFGDAARQRYGALLVAAMRDISAAPERVGSIARPELGAGVRSWHLRLSRERARTETGIVQRPRHFLIYRIEARIIVIGRGLHDVMEREQQLDSGNSWI